MMTCLKLCPNMGEPYMPGWTLRCFCACSMRHLEKAALPRFVVSLTSLASSASRAACSAATVVGLCPKEQPGAVHGRYGVPYLKGCFHPSVRF